MKLTGSHLIVRALRAEGIDTAFALAGDHTLHLMDVMAADGIRFIDTRHEQSAVGMATSWGRVTGTPGVCLFTTPGHANAIPGLTMAGYMGSPVINIVGCAPQDRLGSGAMQEIDQVGMARPVTKGAWMVTDPYRIPEFMARAFRTALTGRRGPVHLTVPLDVQEAEVDESRVRFYRPEEYRPTGPVLGDPERVRDAIELLQSAQRPMAVAGNGAFSATRRGLERLIEVTRLPLFTEEAARGIVPDSHPYCFGLADGRTNPVATHLQDADVVLLLGKKLDFTLSFGGPPSLSAEAKIIQVEPSTDLIGLSRGVDLAIAGDVGAVVDQLAQEAERLEWKEHPMLGELESAGEALERQLEALAEEPGDLHAMAVHKALRPMLDAESCLVFDGGDFPFFGMGYHPSQLPGRWITNGALGMIGWGVPFAIGAQLALPDTRVVVLSGDGSFGFLGMELDTAVRHNLPVVVVMGNDAVWGMDYHQQVALYKRPVATELLTTRYDKIAEALGAHGEFVETAEQLPGALERALNAGKPALVNIRIKPFPSPLTDHIIKVKSG